MTAFLWVLAGFCGGVLFTGLAGVITIIAAAALLGVDDELLRADRDRLQAESDRLRAQLAAAGAHRPPAAPSAATPGRRPETGDYLRPNPASPHRLWPPYAALNGPGGPGLDGIFDLGAPPPPPSPYQPYYSDL